MSAHKKISAIAFDAYGTLFDVYSIGALAEELFPGSGAELAGIWRVAQIDYTRIRTLCGRYRDFWHITSDALHYAAAELHLGLDGEKHRLLMDQYLHLDAFEESLDMVRILKTEGFRLAILSNGTPHMLESAVNAAGMAGLFDHLISVDKVQKFKTAPEAYQLGPDTLGCPPEEILFVSSNGWDVCGASWFGYRTFWVNRAGKLLDNFGVSPSGEGKSLRDLKEFLDQH